MLQISAEGYQTSSSLLENKTLKSKLPVIVNKDGKKQLVEVKISRGIPSSAKVAQLVYKIFIAFKFLLPNCEKIIL